MALYQQYCSCKINAAESERCGMQGVPEKMPTGNVLHVADVVKNYKVRMKKMRPSNGRMHKDYPAGSAFHHHKAEIQQSEEEIKVNY